MANWIVGGLLIALAAWAGRTVWKRRKRGCCGDCSGCSSCEHSRG